MVQLPANPPRGTLVPEQQIHHSAQQRKRTDKQHPENFIRGISGLVDDIQFNRQTQSDKCNIDPRCILCQPQKQDHKPHQLQDNQESDNYHSAGQHADQFFQLSPHNITPLSGSGLLDQCRKNDTVPDRSIAAGTGTGTAVPEAESQDREEQRKDGINDLMQVIKITSEKKHKIETIALWMILILSTAVLFSLCLNEGIDYDEAYSYRTAHDNTMLGIIRVVLDAHDTDVPVWYMGLRLWSFLVGDGIIAYKMFALLGTVLSMLLGPTVIRKQWGSKTAALYMILVSLSPAMMKISVNNRMYSWTVFGVTVCGLTAYFLREHMNSRILWMILFLTTFCGIFSHYFTAFSYKKYEM